MHGADESLHKAARVSRILLRLDVLQTVLAKTDCSTVKSRYLAECCSMDDRCAVQLRAYCGRLGHDKKGERTAVLVRQLADWAVGARHMHAVIKLPLDGLQEQVRQHTYACMHSLTSHTCKLT